jgi:hypothetical protein
MHVDSRRSAGSGQALHGNDSTGYKNGLQPGTKVWSFGNPLNAACGFRQTRKLASAHGRSQGKHLLNFVLPGACLLAEFPDHRSDDKLQIIVAEIVSRFPMAPRWFGDAFGSGEIAGHRLIPDLRIL